MEGFSYHNIFETKGIEYLAVIAFFIILIPFWIALNKRVSLARKLKKSLGFLTANVLKIPQGLFYSKNHTWTHLEVSGIAKVGLDDLLIHLTGEVKIKHLKNIGDQIVKGETLVELEKNGKNLQILSPISGEIINSNTRLADESDLLNEDPYGNGWIYKVKPLNWMAETNSYLMAENANSWLSNELMRFKDFLAETSKKHSSEPAYLTVQDGGELIDNTLSDLPNEVWQDFQKEFLHQKF